MCRVSRCKASSRGAGAQVWGDATPAPPFFASQVRPRMNARKTSRRYPLLGALCSEPSQAISSFLPHVRVGVHLSHRIWQSGPRRSRRASCRSGVRRPSERPRDALAVKAGSYRSSLFRRRPDARLPAGCPQGRSSRRRSLPVWTRIGHRAVGAPGFEPGTSCPPDTCSP